MVVEYNIQSKININLFETYDYDGQSKYDHSVVVTYKINNIEIFDDASIVKIDFDRVYIDIAPLNYIHNDKSISQIKQEYITKHIIIVDKQYIEIALNKHQAIEAKINSCKMYDYKIINIETLSGPKLTDTEINEIFEDLDYSIANDYILLSASLE